MTQFCGQVLSPIRGDHSEKKEGKAMRALHEALGMWWQITHPPHREKTNRGLSQSTENAILLAGAVTVAVLIVTVITAYVSARLPS